VVSVHAAGLATQIAELDADALKGFDAFGLGLFGIGSAVGIAFCTA
jgi:hypothetical protein